MRERELFSIFGKSRFATEEQHRENFKEFCKEHWDELPKIYRYWYRTLPEEEFFNNTKEQWSKFIDRAKADQKRYHRIYERVQD